MFFLKYADTLKVFACSAKIKTILNKCSELSTTAISLTAVEAKDGLYLYWKLDQHDILKSAGKWTDGEPVDILGVHLSLCPLFVYHLLVFNEVYL